MPYPSPWTTDFHDTEFHPVAPKQRYTYRLLADYIRDADTTGDLEAFIDGAEAALGPEIRFLDAADPDTGTTGVSEPVHPDYCPAAWLPWLARLLGADIRGLTEAQARWYLTRHSAAKVGSDAGLALAVAASLKNTRYVAVTHPSLWEITVTISNDDLVDIALTTAVATRNKPAGTRLTLNPLDPVTLAELDTAYSSLAAVYATGKTLDQLRFG